MKNHKCDIYKILKDQKNIYLLIMQKINTIILIFIKKISINM